MRTHPTFSFAAAALAVLSQLDGVSAWGVAGHQIVATIAQIHLHPSTRAAVAEILPEWTKGQLAAIAAWPDRVRMHLPWSGQLHYATPIDPEHPPENCAWDGHFKAERNVINAIQNYTIRVGLDKDDIDLRFLVHYIGDVHQPLHLTGRERGGNGDPIVFERRHMSLHGLWDTALLTKSIREIHNYTRPVPSRQIESALTGAIYDPYVRWVVWEGIRDWWIKDLPEWLSCDSPVAGNKQQTQTVFSGTSNRLQAAMDRVVCPHDWAPEVHAYCCSHVFPPKYNMTAPAEELNTPAYYGRIQNDKVVESLLAKGGFRLAAVLNTLLADEAELRTYGLVRDPREVMLEEESDAADKPWWRWLG